VWAFKKSGVLPMCMSAPKAGILPRVQAAPQSMKAERLTRYENPAIFCLCIDFNKNVKNENKEVKVTSGKPNLMDQLFGLTLLGVIAFVSWVGYLSFHEGLKIETSKRYGEAWMQWLGDASRKRFQANFQPAACAGQITSVAAPLAAASDATSSATTGNAAMANTWGACFKALTQTDGPWASQINPFSGAQVQLVPKCDKTDLSVAGQLVFEKLTPTPPGSTVPVVASLLIDGDLLDQKILLRMTLCDKGGDPIRIGEFEF
jgi:hypothetical protein